ncbi:hypothetical protein HDU96_004326 [Phlyctochytrium bullatum]|nr:hypothetical protein HDU96_004326 [Phlyctochytrium bullatum]
MHIEEVNEAPQQQQQQQPAKPAPALKKKVSILPSTDYLAVLNLKSNVDIIALQEALEKKKTLTKEVEAAVQLAVRAEEDLIAARDHPDHPVAGGADAADRVWEKAKSLERQTEQAEAEVKELDRKALDAVRFAYDALQARGRAGEDVREAYEVLGNVKTLHRHLATCGRLKGAAGAGKAEGGKDGRPAAGKKQLAELPSQPTIPEVEYLEATKKVHVRWSCAFAESRNVLGYEVSVRSAEGAWKAVWTGVESECIFTPSVYGIVSFRVRARNHVGWGVYSIARDLAIQDPHASEQPKKKKSTSSLNGSASSSGSSAAPSAPSDIRTRLKAIMTIANPSDRLPVLRALLAEAESKPSTRLEYAKEVTAAIASTENLLRKESQQLSTEWRARLTTMTQAVLRGDGDDSVGAAGAAGSEFAEVLEGIVAGGRAGGDDDDEVPPHIRNQICQAVRALVERRPRKLAPAVSGEGVVVTQGLGALRRVLGVLVAFAGAYQRGVFVGATAQGLASGWVDLVKGEVEGAVARHEEKAEAFEREEGERMRKVEERREELAKAQREREEEMKRRREAAEAAEKKAREEREERERAEEEEEEARPGERKKVGFRVAGRPQRRFVRNTNGPRRLDDEGEEGGEQRQGGYVQRRPQQQGYRQPGARPYVPRNGVRPAPQARTVIDLNGPAGPVRRRFDAVNGKGPQDGVEPEPAAGEASAEGAEGGVVRKRKPFVARGPLNRVQRRPFVGGRFQRQGGQLQQRPPRAAGAEDAEEEEEEVDFAEQQAGGATGAADGDVEKPYKTVRCRFAFSRMGCKRGTACTFLHPEDLPPRKAQTDRRRMIERETGGVVTEAPAASTSAAPASAAAPAPAKKEEAGPAVESAVAVAAERASVEKAGEEGVVKRKPSFRKARCIFFNTARGCAKGGQCTFYHAAPRPRPAAAAEGEDAKEKSKEKEQWADDVAGLQGGEAAEAAPEKRGTVRPRRAAAAGVGPRKPYDPLLAMAKRLQMPKVLIQNLKKFTKNSDLPYLRAEDLEALGFVTPNLRNSFLKMIRFFAKRPGTFAEKKEEVEVVEEFEGEVVEEEPAPPVAVEVKPVSTAKWLEGLELGHLASAAGARTREDLAKMTVASLRLPAEEGGLGVEDVGELIKLRVALCKAVPPVVPAPAVVAAPEVVAVPDVAAPVVAVQ